MNPFFSAQSVRKLQPVIEERVDALLERLREDGKKAKGPIDILYPFSAFTSGVLRLIIPQLTRGRAGLYTEQMSSTSMRLQGVTTRESVPLVLSSLQIVPCRILTITTVEDPSYGKDVTDWLLTGTHYG